MTFKILKHKTIEGFFGVIDYESQSVCVQNKPEVYWANDTIEILTKYIDPRIPNPFDAFDLIPIEV
jgi:hypothetical protein